MDASVAAAIASMTTPRNWFFPDAIFLIPMTAPSSVRNHGIVIRSALGEDPLQEWQITVFSGRFRKVAATPRGVTIVFDLNEPDPILLCRCAPAHQKQVRLQSTEGLEGIFG